MPQPPKITIGIPAYNRPRELRDAVESILSQLDSDSQAQLEILICDDCSSGDMPAIAKDYAEKRPGLIRYHRNSTNLGYSRNVHSLFQRGTGEYVWLLGDDDALEPGALRRVLETLQQYPDLAVLFLGSRAYDATLQQRLTPPSAEDTPAQVRYFPSGREMFAQTGQLACALLSSNVIHRAKWLAEDLDSAFASIAIHANATMKILAHSSGALLAEPLIKCRTSNSPRGRWVDDGYPFNFFFGIIACWTHECRSLYPSRIYHAHHTVLLRGLVADLIRARKQRYPVNRRAFVRRVRASCSQTAPMSWLLMLMPYIPRALLITADKIYARHRR
ncbi:MAG: glycosyltransferase [Magnetococcus sp. WYHC-3]